MKFLLHSRVPIIALTAALAIIIGSCGNNGSSVNADADSSVYSNAEQTTSTALKPKGNDPAWGPSIGDEMLVVMKNYSSMVIRLLSRSRLLRPGPNIHQPTP